MYIYIYICIYDICIFIRIYICISCMNISYALYIYIYIYTRIHSLSGLSMCFHFTCFMIANSLVCTYLHTSICPQTYHTHFYSAKYFSSAVETWLDQYVYVYVYVNTYIYIYIHVYWVRFTCFTIANSRYGSCVRTMTCICHSSLANVIRLVHTLRAASNMCALHTRNTENPSHTHSHTPVHPPSRT